MEEGNRVKLDADKIYRAIGPTGIRLRCIDLSAFPK